MNYTSIIMAFLTGGCGVAIVNAISNAVSTKRLNQEKEIKEIREDLAILKVATQASLRNSLRKKYRECRNQGYASFEDRDDFEFMYQQYHQLHGNGVMTDCYNKFMSLEIKEEE